MTVTYRVEHRTGPGDAWVNAFTDEAPDERSGRHWMAQAYGQSTGIIYEHRLIAVDDVTRMTQVIQHRPKRAPGPRRYRMD